MVGASSSAEQEIPGQTTIDDQVIGAIARTAAQEIPGVAQLGTSSVRRRVFEQLGRADRQSRGVGVVAGQREAIVELDLHVYYGYSIPEIVNQVRESVSTRIQEMCGLATREINVTISGIEFSQDDAGRFRLVE